MEDLVKVFIDSFLKNTKHILTPNVVREVYDNCTALTATIMDNPESVLKVTLNEMAQYLGVPSIIIQEKKRIDIGLCDNYGDFIIPIEVENNSGHGDRDNIIFSTEIDKLVRFHGRLMVFLTYDYNEEDRQNNIIYGNWRFNFTKRLDDFLNIEKPGSPFLFIVGNTPLYAGNLRTYPDEDCIVNWTFWIKPPENPGYWFPRFLNDLPTQKLIVPS